MLPCAGCGYRQEIPGDVHVRCAYRWDLNEASLDAILPTIVKAAGNPKISRWFRWPFNFDPTWGPDICPARADKADPAMTLPESPLGDLLSFLARRP